mmetsp:Transcript_21863/g.65243  ORF Transcript_21863/g.65243 Transcript_21863/m.65243 type:complete len:751 (-) Transcript_21863:62-2314(-)
MEHVLVGEALDGGNPQQRRLLAVGHLLHLHEQLVGKLQPEHDQVDDALQGPARVLDQGALARAQLVGEVLQRLRPPLPEDGEVHAVGLQLLRELVLAEAARRLHQSADLPGHLGRAQPHPPLLGLLVREPEVGPEGAFGVRCLVLEVRAAEARVGQEPLVRVQEFARNDLLPVHSPDSWIGRRVVLLLEHLRVREVEADAQLAQAEPLLEDPLCHLQGALVRRPLGAGELIDAHPHPAVLEVLRALHERPPLTRLPVAEAKQHDVDDPHHALVPRRVHHHARRAALELLRELLQRLRPADAELLRIDAVVLQHLRDGLHAAVGALLQLRHAAERPGGGGDPQYHPAGRRRDRRLGSLKSLGGLPSPLAEAHDLLEGLPRERVHLPAPPVAHLEALTPAGGDRQQGGRGPPRRRRLLPGGPHRGLQEPVDQLLAPVGHEPRRAVLAGHRLRRLPGEARGEQGAAALSGARRGLRREEGRPKCREEGVAEELRRAGPLVLVLDEGLGEEVLERGLGHLGEADLPGLDVDLPLEGELAGHHAEEHHACRPDVDLQRVVEPEDLGGPVHLRAARRLQARPRQTLMHRAEVAENEPYIGIGHVGAVHEVVVALDVPVGAVVLVQPGNGHQHLLREPRELLCRDHTAVRPLPLGALDEITSEEVHDHADEDLLLEDGLQLDDAGVLQPPEHLALLPDLVKRGLDPVDHLDGVLGADGPLDLVALVHDPERALTEHLAEAKLLQQPPSGSPIPAVDE